MPRDMLSPNTDDSLAVRVLEILRRRKILAVTTFMTVLAAALAFARYLPDLYRGTAMVLIERPISESILKAPVSGELESRLYVIKQEILSRDRLTQLINRFDLYPELRKREGIEEALTQARNDVVIQPAGPEQVSGRVKTVSFSLSFTGDSRETVAEVTNAIAAFYLAQNTAMRSGEATRTTQFLNQQLIEAKKELDRHERALSEYTTRHVGELPQQVGVNLATLERLNTQLRLNGEQQIRIIEQREKLFEGTREPGSVGARATDPDASPETIERLRQIEKLKTEMVGLETKTTPRHPDVIRLREQIAALEREAAAAEAAELQKRDEAAKLATAKAEQARNDAVNGPRATAPTPDAREPRRRAGEAAPGRGRDPPDDRVLRAAARERSAAAAGISTDHARLLGGQGSLRLPAPPLRGSAAHREHGNRQPRRTLSHSGTRASARGAVSPEPDAAHDHGPAAGLRGRRRGGSRARTVRYFVSQRGRAA